MWQIKISLNSVQRRVCSQVCHTYCFWPAHIFNVCMMKRAEWNLVCGYMASALSVWPDLGCTPIFLSWSHRQEHGSSRESKSAQAAHSDPSLRIRFDAHWTLCNHKVMQFWSGLWRSPDQTPAQSRVVSELSLGCSELNPVRFWKPTRMETAEPLGQSQWVLLSCGRTFSLYPGLIFLYSTYTCCL